MKEYVRLACAELYKIRRTFLIPVHVLLPLTALALFGGYYKITEYTAIEQGLLYIQTLSIALPAVISVICAMSVRLEAQNHFLVFCGTASPRINALLAKAGVLILFAFFSLFLAMGGFAAEQMWMWGELFIEWDSYLKIGLLLWACSVGIYFLHLFLSLRWTETISMCIGALGSLLAAILQTGVGDEVWQYFLYAYSGRWSQYLLLCNLGYKQAFSNSEILEKVCVNAGITLGIGTLILLWSVRWEGRNSDD